MHLSIICLSYLKMFEVYYLVDGVETVDPNK